MARFFLYITFILAILLTSERVVSWVKPQQVWSKSFWQNFGCFVDTPYIPETLKKSATCHIDHINNEFHVITTTDQFGYRRDTKYDDKKSVDILLMGDSFMFGWGLDDASTIGHKLQVNLEAQYGRDVNMINAGFADGRSPDGYYVFLKNNIQLIKPKIIILEIFPWNDIDELMIHTWSQTDDRGMPVKIKMDQGTPFRYRYPILRESHLYQLIMNIIPTSVIQSIETQSSKKSYPVIFGHGCALVPECFQKMATYEKQFFSLLSEIDVLARENNAKLIIMVIPVDYQVDQSYLYKYSSGIYNPDQSQTDFIQRKIQEKFTLMNITSLDLLPILIEEQYKGREYFNGDGHLNTIGATIVANTVSNYLQDNGL